MAAHREASHRPIPIVLDIRGRSDPQQIRVSWTQVHLGGERPWMHCPHCQTRVAKLYAGLGGYFCRACVGNPPYASQQLSAQGRAHFQACKLRLLLDGEAQLSRHFQSARHGCIGARTSGSDERG